jgi:hypothetical protein
MLMTATRPFATARFPAHEVDATGNVARRDFLDDDPAIVGSGNLVSDVLGGIVGIFTESNVEPPVRPVSLIVEHVHIEARREYSLNLDK